MVNKEIVKWIGIVVLTLLSLLTIFGAGYLYGNSKATNKYQAVISQMQKRADEIKVNQKDNVIYVETEVVRVEKEIKVVYKDRIKEVVKYEQAVPDARDPIGTEWVLVHDTLAAGSNPFDRSAPGVADAAARITKADALKVIAQNYEAYQLCKARNEMWQMFYAKQQESFIKPGD